MKGYKMKCYGNLKNTKAYLTIEGNLNDSDALNLESALILTLSKCEILRLNIDNVTFISIHCAKIITRSIRIAQQKKKQLLLDTRYQREAMLQWIQYIFNLPIDSTV